jgi:hypothetical protein
MRIFGQICRVSIAVCATHKALRCISYQKALFGLYLCLSCVVDPTVPAVNFFRSKEFKRFQFYTFLIQI